MNTKRLIINMVSNVMSFIVSMGISFLLTPYIINTVGKEAYGFVGLANNFVSYAQLITLALNALALRFITVKIHENNIEEANKYFTSVILANIFTSIILIVPAVGIICFIDKLIDVPIDIVIDVQILWAFVFLNFLISIITATFNVATFATNRLDLSARRSIESNFLRVIILVSLFLVFKPQIWYLGIAAIICTVFVFITDLYYKKMLLPELKVKVKYFDINIIKELFKSGIWSVVTKLGQILSDGLDLLITNIFIDAAAMGVLAIAKTIPTAISGLLITISGVFSPQLTIYYAKNDTEGLVKELDRSMKISGVFTNIALGFMIVFGYAFYSLWIPDQDIVLIQVLSILTVQAGIVGGVINSLFGVFTITNKLKVNSYVTLGTGVLNAVIVFILLKTTSLGILAVAGVSTTTAIVKNLTFTPIYAARCLNIPKTTFYPLITKYIITTACIVGTYVGIYKIFPVKSWIELIITAIVCGGIGILINFVVLFNREERVAGILYVKGIVLKHKKRDG